MAPGGGPFCLFSVQFSPRSDEVVGGSSDSHIYVYNIAAGRRLERIAAHDDDVNAVAWGDAGGSIIFQGSISSFLAQPNCATYATMKGALVQLARNCAYDFACVQLAGLPGVR